MAVCTRGSRRGEDVNPLGDGWRLPTNDEWRQMAKHYGGVREDSDDSGKAAYKALLIGGSSGFNALLSGGISDDGQYARLEAHGFYWTASESDSVSAWFYNFGQGGLSLNRHSGGKKQNWIFTKDDDVQAFTDLMNNHDRPVGRGAAVPQPQHGSRERVFW